MDWMKRAWSGQERLWKVFWIYGFVFNLILSIISFAIALFISPAAAKGFGIVTLAYFIFIAVSEWRCAFNTNWKGWGYIVRVLIVLGVIGQVFILINTLKGGGAGQSSASFTFDKHADLVVNTSGNAKMNLTPAAPATSVAAPVTAPVSTPSANQDDQYKANCEQTMTDYAKKNGADPKLYIAQNQAYIQKCVQYYKDKAVPGR